MGIEFTETVEREETFAEFPAVAYDGRADRFEAADESKEEDKSEDADRVDDETEGFESRTDESLASEADALIPIAVTEPSPETEPLKPAALKTEAPKDASTLGANAPTAKVLPLEAPTPAPTSTSTPAPAPAPTASSATTDASINVVA